MEDITTILFISIGFNLVRLSGTCVDQCFTKGHFTIKCHIDAFVVEGVISMMHCAYKCRRDEHCLLFQHSNTTKKCHGCRVFDNGREELSDTVVYMPHPDNFFDCDFEGKSPIRLGRIIVQKTGEKTPGTHGTLTGTPYDERDAVCRTSCRGEPVEGCEEINMAFVVSQNRACYERCKDLLGFRYYAEREKDQKKFCMCGYSDRLTPTNYLCNKVCPKNSVTCEEITVYKYRYGC